MAFPNVVRSLDGVPISTVYVPGVGFIAMAGSTRSNTDGSGNTSTPALIEAIPVDSLKATYSASVAGLVPITGATDIFTLTGSGTKTVRVTRVAISVSCTLATTNILPITLLRRSTANSVGTAVTMVSYDSTNIPATALAQSYTAVPTPGTLVGNLHNFRIMPQLTALTATDFPSMSNVYTIDFGIRPSQAIVLRGTTQVFAINLNAIATITGWLFDISLEWSEE